MSTRPSRRVLVVGSCIIDLAFRVNELPRVGETRVATSLTRTLGGKGFNQAIALARLGLETVFISAVGDQASLDEFADMLRAEGGDPRLHLIDDAPTGTGVPVVDATGENTIVVFPGASMHLPMAAAKEALEYGTFDAILVHLEAPQEVLKAVLRHARNEHVLSFVNPAPWMPGAREVAKLGDIVVPNLLEAERLFDPTGSEATEQSPSTLARSCATSLGIETLVLTLGKAGAIACSRGEVTTSPGFAIEPIDVTGAGDAFVAGLLAGYLESRDLTDALALANAAGALACLTPGASLAMPTIAAVDELRKRGIASDARKNGRVGP